MHMIRDIDHMGMHNGLWQNKTNFTESSAFDLLFLHKSRLKYVKP